MAKTSKNNIYYNDDENSIADVLADMKKLAESTDEAIENVKYDDKQIKQNISNIEEKNTEQDKNITNNTKSIEELKTENETLRAENKLIKEQIPSASASGNSIHVEDSGTLDFDWKIKGGHKQENREGYNLYDVNTLIVNQENVTVEKNETGYIIKSDDTVTPSKIGRAVIETTSLFDISKNYTFSCDITLNKAGKSVAGWVGLENTIQKDITANQKEHVVIRINSQVGTYLTLGLYISNCVMTVENIQLVEGLEDKPYEQYGVSPSPDYPSEIETVGSNVNYFDENTVESKFLNSKTGKTSDNTYWRCTDFVKILSKQYNFSWESDSVYFQVTVCYYDKNKTFISGNEYGLYGIYSKTFEIPDGTNYMKVAYSIVVSGKPVTRDKIKLEIGNKRTLYSPFMCGSVEIDVVNKNLLNIANTEETTKGGITYSVKNGILKLNGTATAGFDIQLSKNIKIKKGKYTHSSSYIQSGLYISFDNLRYTMISSTVGKKITFEITEDTTYKRYFIWIDKGTVLNNVEIKLQLEVGDTATNLDEHQSQSVIMPIQQEMLEGDYVADVEHHEWGKIESYNGENITTNYISTTGELSTGATVYYKLTTPVDLELTSEQKVVREQKLYTYKNITNIAVSNELASIDVTYKKDLETEHNKLQKEIDEIKQLISTTETSALLLDNLQKDVESEVE